MPKRSYRAAINDALRLEMERDPDVVLIGEDVRGGAGGSAGEVEAYGGVMGVTKGLWKQFGSARGYALLLLGLVALALAVTAWLRHSRFGAQLQAVRDNEDAARALGIDPLRTKLAACVLSAAFMGAAGAVYLQMFQYIDPAIAFGPTTSVEALLGAIVGGMGTLWGPVLGALALHVLSDVTRNLFGALPGINMVIYGVVLVVIVMFMPRGIAGIGRSVRSLWQGGRRG